jgi:hypothetical protein
LISFLIFLSNPLPNPNLLPPPHGIHIDRCTNYHMNLVKQRKLNFVTIFAHNLVQALKYRSVTDIVRPIREIVRRTEETTGHSVRPK